MEQSEMRKALIESAVYVVSHNGIAHVTTDALVKRANVNVAYLYRVCGGKDKLLEDTFTELDCEFRDAIMKYIDLLYEESLPFEQRFWLFFAKVWEFIMSDKDKCSFFIYYYHSIYFNSYSIDLRKKTYKPVLEKMDPKLKDGASSWRILNHIFDVLFSSALKAMRNHVTHDNEFVEEVFTLIYKSIEPYMNNEIIEGVTK